MDRRQVVVDIHDHRDTLRPHHTHSLRHVGVRDPLEHDHVRVDEDVLDGVALHDETDTPVLRAHHLNVMTGRGAVLAGPDCPEAAASLAVAGVYEGLHG